MNIQRVCDVGAAYGLTHYTLIAHFVIEAAYKLQEKFYIKKHKGFLNTNFQDILNEIKKHNLVEGMSSTDNPVFLWKEGDLVTGYISLYHFEDRNEVDFFLFSCKEEHTNIFQELKKLTNKKTENLAYVITATDGGFSTISLGDVSSEFIPDNYNDEVVDAFEYVKKCLSTNSNKGKIIILNGEPGTGKTHLIKSLLRSDKSVFIMVPSAIAGYLDKPDFITFLIGLKEEFSGKQIVLVIEDGDECLVNRSEGDMSTIAALLNLSDGIVGSCLNIKIVISSNAEINNIDRAILRPGRLLKRIQVDALSPEKAIKVFNRVKENKEMVLPVQDKYTLAQIYSFAFDGEVIEPSNKKQKVIGFSL